MYVCMLACMHEWICISVCMYACLYVCVRVYNIFISVLNCVHAYMMHVRIHASKHTIHIHTLCS